MALSPIARVKLQREYTDTRKQSVTAKPLDRIKLLKSCKEMLAILKGTSAPKDETVTPAVNPRLAALLAGYYNKLSPEAFQTILQQIVEEIKDVQAVKPGIRAYIDASLADGRLVMESATHKKLEEMLAA